MQRRTQKEAKEFAESFSSIIPRYLTSMSYPSASEMLIKITPPHDALWAGKEISVNIRFPPDYPFKPFKIEITGIVHPNFSCNSSYNVTGCKPDWSPALTVNGFVSCLLRLFAFPMRSTWLSCGSREPAQRVMTLFQNDLEGFVRSTGVKKPFVASVTQTLRRLYEYEDMCRVPTEDQKTNGEFTSSFVQAPSSSAASTTSATTFQAVSKTISASSSASSSVPIFIVKTLTGKSFELDYDPSRTIFDIKLEISTKMGARSDDLRVIFQGCNLEDNVTLSERKVEPNSILHAIERLRGCGSSQIISVLFPPVYVDLPLQVKLAFIRLPASCVFIVASGRSLSLGAALSKHICMAIFSFLEGWKPTHASAWWGKVRFE